MEYNFSAIEKKWQKKWQEEQTYKVSEDSNKEKFYALDMFPYPSGAGLHVGHPLGYIASDVFARYKVHQGFNVLHPMGYDSFGLPAEQYAIQTGQHPAITTKNNIQRYREQLDQIGFNYDWSREVRTSSAEYYKWTQWIFAQLFDSWYNVESDKAEPLSTLVAAFENNGTYNVNASVDENWWKNLTQADFPHFGEHFVGEFTATDWNSFTDRQKQLVLMNFRMTYLADSMVNWCPELGTVLANDEIKDGVSERGGHPVVQKLMRQWSMRISAYAERLLKDLNEIDWSDSIKEVQKNWIGKSVGASVNFQVENHADTIEVFTTRPDTIFGVSFMVLAPEHKLVEQITTEDYRKDVDTYVTNAQRKTERDRQSNVKEVSGQFTGAYAVHPFTGKKIPIWIGEYVLVSYGTGAVMAVPAGDERDHAFAQEFGIPIPPIFEGVDTNEEAVTSKKAILQNSDFLNGKSTKDAMYHCIKAMEEQGFGKGKTNYRLRDAVFSRQRYWGEPFPIFYKDDLPYLIPENEMVTLPEVDKYLPTEDGEPPLARAQKEAWNVFHGDRMEQNTMPGWAGSSWYFLRYMDPNNVQEFVSKEKADYWGQVDLYIGGAEHATGHLLYSRFWTKFLFDRGFIGIKEPFAKMINQGMILGRSSLAYRIQVRTTVDGLHHDASSGYFISNDLRVAIEKEHSQRVPLSNFMADLNTANAQFNSSSLETKLKEMDADQKDAYVWFCPQHVLIDHVENDILNLETIKTWQPEYAEASYICNSDGQFQTAYEVDKMSKRWYNVVNPDDLCEKYGADTLRLYEMFLGPLEQSKPWDTNGISGVHNFLRKTWRLFHNSENEVEISDEQPSKAALKAIHKTIKKVSDDLNRYSWNTVVSALMIGVNELTDAKSNHRSALEALCVLLSPYAPHMAEELWSKLGHSTSVTKAAWPEFNEEHLKESDFEYPVSFNGKMRFKLSLPVEMGPKEVEESVLAHENTSKFLDGKPAKKVIVVPKRIVNIVM
ncbi:MAG: leucine--tRNA ligase [Flavobacteriales bacterium]